MGTLHHLIRRHGRDEARRRIDNEDLPFFAVASSILEESSDETGLTYSGFCFTSLPHRRLKPDQPWFRRNGRVSLLVEPGRRPTTRTPNGPEDYEFLGVPYGPKARLILLYLQTEAVRNRSPVVELGRSMNAWLMRMEIPTGGRTYAEVRTQAERISRCRLSFDYHGDDGRKGFSNEGFVRDGISLRADDRQAHLWEDTVRLSQGFYDVLTAHPVPVWEPAIKHLASKSAALDVYIWLAYRLRALDRPTSVSWTALHAQFGSGDASALRGFKAGFREAMRYALAVYEEARVEEADGGFMLHPSAPPIPERRIGKPG